MLKKIKESINEILKLSETKPIKVISHFDTDGITSAAIFSKALQRKEIKFSLQIKKSLEKEYIDTLSDSSVLIFLDLASNSLNYLKDKKTEVFIFDHHEITQEIPSNIRIINPLLEKQEPVCSAAICYLFAKSLSSENIDLANLAVIGMVGDRHESNINKIYDEIIKDSETTTKKGLLLYPSTRPLDKALEYSSSPYIPGVAGSYTGVLELLKDAGISKENGQYKALYELSQEEMSNLLTAVSLRTIGKTPPENLIGTLYLIKFFNKLEDARELSALINACSRMDQPYTCLGFCLGNKKSKQDAEKIYITYKQNLVSALKYISETEKITGEKYMIINTKDNIKDTIIGTVTSIISHSPTYEKGTVIVALAYNEDKIKVSARIAGRSGRNVREVLSKVVIPLGGEVGGHPEAAGCLISREKEALFISELRKTLEIEVKKV